jgi:plasmid stabilization system protein ParE
VRVVFSRAARRQSRDAATAFQHRDPESVPAFQRRLDEAVARLSDFAALGTPIAATQLRRLPLIPFPYLLIYQVLADRIRIVAVPHAKQAPRSWRDR